MSSTTSTHPLIEHVDKRRPPNSVKNLAIPDPRTKPQRPHIPVLLVQGDHQSDGIRLHLSQGNQSLINPGSGLWSLVMLANLPHHLGSHVASSVTNVGVEIGEYILALGVGEENVVGRVGEGKGFEGVLDGLETMESM